MTRMCVCVWGKGTLLLQEKFSMLISIKIETSDDLHMVEPVLALLGKSKARISVKTESDLAESRKKAMRQLIQFIHESAFPVVTKIEIPDRNERNARR